MANELARKNDAGFETKGYRDRFRQSNGSDAYGTRPQENGGLVQGAQGDGLGARTARSLGSRSSWLSRSAACGGGSPLPQERNIPRAPPEESRTNGTLRR